MITFEMIIEHDISKVSTNFSRIMSLGQICIGSCHSVMSFCKRGAPYTTEQLKSTEQNATYRVILQLVKEPLNKAIRIKG